PVSTRLYAQYGTRRRYDPRSRGRNKIRRKPSYILFGFRGSPLAFSEALSGEEPVNAKNLPRLVRSNADIPVASLRARSEQLPLLLLTSTSQVCCCAEGTLVTIQRKLVLIFRVLGPIWAPRRRR